MTEPAPIVLFPCVCGQTLDVKPGRLQNCCLYAAGYTPWQRYNHSDLHGQLCDISLSDRYRDGQCGAQALHCPYYVPLDGKLGADWGVIVNPASTRFGKLTFEHDDCGCPETPDEDDEGWGRHEGAIQQETDTWDIDYVHEHDTFWCDFGDDCPLVPPDPEGDGCTVIGTDRRRDGEQDDG